MSVLERLQHDGQVMRVDSFESIASYGTDFWIR